MELERATFLVSKTPRQLCPTKGNKLSSRAAPEFPNVARHVASANGSTSCAFNIFRHFRSILWSASCLPVRIPFFLSCKLLTGSPNSRGTPISLLHRFLWIQFPNAVKWLDLRLTNGVLSTVGSRLCSYLLYEKHPLVVV